MRINTKTGILLLTLAIPVFIWLFLKLFGQNSFDLPVYYSEGVNTEACNATNQAHSVPNFILQTSDSGTVSSDFLSEQIVISHFLPNECSEDCVQVLENIANLQSVFSKEYALKILTIAPEHYSFEELARLSKRFNIDPELWVVAKAKQQKVNELQQCGFILSDYSQNTFVLTDPERQIRGYYNALDSDEVDRMKGEIKILEYLLENFRND